MQMTTYPLRFGKVRVFFGPYNTICQTRDIFRVKVQFQKIIEAQKKRCPTCKQEVKCTKV